MGGSGSPCSSPNISVGPPQSPPTNPYTNLFNSSLYQQYLGQLLANGGGPQTPLNPMLLQVRTHLVFFFYNPLLKCSTCAGPACHGCPKQPGPLAGQLQQPRHQLDLRTSEGLEQVLAVPGVLDHRADRLHVGLLLPNGHRVRVQVVGRGVQAGRAARHPAAHQVRQPPGVTASLGKPAQVDQDLLFFLWIVPEGILSRIFVILRGRRCYSGWVVRSELSSPRKYFCLTFQLLAREPHISPASCTTSGFGREYFSTLNTHNTRNTFNLFPSSRLASSPASSLKSEDPPPPSSPSRTTSPTSSPSLSTNVPNRSNIKSIENMINGLNGSHEGRFGLNHDARIS